MSRMFSICLLMLLVTRPLAAQEMTFEPEEVEPPPADSAAPPPTPPAGTTTVPEGLPRAVVLVIPSGDAEKALAAALTEALSRQVLAVGKVEVMPSEDFQARLFAPGEKAAQDCAANSTCLGGYGKELWLDKIIMGVLFRGESGYNLNVDLVGVESAEVEQYANRDLARLEQMDREKLDAEMAGVVFKLFNLRDPSLTRDGDSRKILVPKAGPLQIGLAWTSAGLAGAALVTGLVLGAQARSIASELDSDTTLTQRAFSEKIDEGSGKALGAYLAFAATGVMLATAATLFLVKPLQEVDRPASQPTRGFGPGASLTPYWLPGATGADAGMSVGLKF